MLSNSAWKLPSPNPRCLALDDLEEDRPDRVVGEDLQQLALVVSGSASIRILFLASRDTSSPWLERAGLSRRNRCRRIQELHALPAHRFHGRVDIVGEAGDVLDAFAMVGVQVFVDLRLRSLDSLSGMRTTPSGAVIALDTRPVLAPLMSK